MSRYLFAFLFIALIALPSSGQTAEDLYQQAVRVERLTGNTEAAIALYEQIVEEHSENRAITAKSLVGLGRLFESIGNEKARKSYEQVLASFSDFPDESAIARQGLRRTSIVSSEPTAFEAGSRSFVQFPEGGDAWGSALSPDGKELLSWDYDKMAISVTSTITWKSNWYQPVLEGDVHDLETGLYAEYPRMSPDGRFIASGWWGRDSTFSEVRIYDTETATTKVPFQPRNFLSGQGKTDLSSGGVYVYDWSIDGRDILILAYGYNEDRSAREMNLMLLPVDGGEPRVLLKTEDMQEFSWGNACLTSSGDWVVVEFRNQSSQFNYLKRVNVASGQTSVWRGGIHSSVSLSSCVGNKDEVIYQANSINSTLIKLGDVASLEAVEDRSLMSTSSPGFGVMGSRVGDVVVGGQTNSRSLYLASISPDSGDILSTTRRIDEDVSLYSGGWTPDGNEIIWWKDMEVANILNIENNQVRSTRVDTVSGLLGNHALPGGDKILSFKIIPGGRNRYHTVIWNKKDGSIHSYLDFNSTDRKGLKLRGLHPDGVSAIAWNRESKCLHRVDFISKESAQMRCFPDHYPETVIISESPVFSHYALNFAGPDSFGPLLVMSAEDLSVREVLKREEGDDPIGWVQWGGPRHLYFAQGPNLFWNIDSVVRMDLRTGESTTVFEGLLTEMNISSFLISPKGDQFTYTGRQKAINDEEGYSLIRNLVDLAENE